MASLWSKNCLQPEKVIAAPLMNKSHVRIQRGGGGNKGYGPHENSQNIAFSSNTGPDPLKNRNATKPALNAGPSSSLQRNIYLNNGDTSRTRVVNLGTTTKLC